MSDTSESMITRVARAMYEATPFKRSAGGYDEQSDGYKRMCMLLARAAIEAMRSPTEAMIDARFQTMGRGGKAAWQAMIDAALSEDKP